MMRAAAIQMCSGLEPGPNIAALDLLVAEAASGGADYVLTPEVSIAFAESREGLRAVAAPWPDNPALASMGAMARRHGLYLHLGSLAVALEDGRFANRSVLFSPQGEVAATYDKIHLFDASLPGTQPYKESATYRCGEKAVTAAIGGLRLGMTICYDVRFPALHRALAQAGAHVLAVPAAFTVPTGQAHWEVLLRARAIETGCYVIAAAQGGRHQNGRVTYGHSMIVDPWGKILAELDGDRPGIIFAEINDMAVNEARARVPALANARPFSLSINDSGAI